MLVQKAQGESAIAKTTGSLDCELFERMLLIRRFEERLLDEFTRGRLFGTTHAYIGQEANAVGLIGELGSEDVVFSNHRCHGHFLAYGGDPHLLAAELMGKATGLCGGRGGSQHICFRNFYSNGVQGGIVPCATGMALAEKVRGQRAIVVVFLGDGTLGEGVVYESLNIAALWSLPILYVVENNRYAQTTPIRLALAGSIRKRFEAFGIHTAELESSDVTAVRAHAQPAITRVRDRREPGALILHTHRMCAHSKGDDTRDAQELDACREHDPLLVHGQRVSPAERARAESACMTRLDAVFAAAYADPFPDPASLVPALPSLR